MTGETDPESPVISHKPNVIACHILNSEQGLRGEVKTKKAKPKLDLSRSTNPPEPNTHKVSSLLFVLVVEPFLCFCHWPGFLVVAR